MPFKSRLEGKKKVIGPSQDPGRGAFEMLLKYKLIEMVQWLSSPINVFGSGLHLTDGYGEH